MKPRRPLTSTLAIIGPNHEDKGVEELRVWDDSGTYRMIYTARLADAVYVLHAFQKKTQTTAKRDVELARKRYTDLTRGAE